MNKLLLILMIFISFTTSVGAYEFEASINQHLRNEETLSCTLTYDNISETFEYDKDTKEIKKHFNEDFRDYITISCNKLVNKINLNVYNDKKTLIETKFERRKYSLSYKLKEKEVSLYLRNDELKDLECNLSIDNQKEEYYFGKTIKEKLKFNVINKFYLKCNQEIDEIEKIIELDNKEISYELKRDSNSLNYNKDTNKIIDKEVFIYFQDPFEKKTTCIIKSDSEEEKEYIFNDKTKLSSKIAYIDFRDTFNIKCNNNIKSIDLSITSLKTGKNIDKINANNRNSLNYKYLEPLKTINKYNLDISKNKTINKTDISIPEKKVSKVIELAPVIEKEEIDISKNETMNESKLINQTNPTEKNIEEPKKEKSNILTYIIVGILSFIILIIIKRR